MIGPLFLVLSIIQQDTLTLARAHALAVAQDPRQIKSTLASTATEARLAASALEKKPQFVLRAEATHQSDVTGIPGVLPGVSVSQPPRDRVQATLNIEQLLYDAGARVAREAVERARLTEIQAGIAVSSYSLLTEVDAQFFSAWMQQERADNYDLIERELAGRLGAVRIRVAQGAALPRDSAAIEAERLTVLRRRDDALAAKAAALEVLSQLTGEAIPPSVRLSLPDLSSLTQGITPVLVRDSLANRPEFALLRSTDARLQRELELTSAVNRPRVVAFGQSGLGRPGLNQFKTAIAAFWVAGVKLEWRPFTWGSAELSAKSINAQQRALNADAAALGQQLARAATTDLARIDRVRSAAITDANITALRQIVANTARTQFDEGVMTAAEYLSAQTALLEAQLTEQSDRTELARLQATLLTTLGIAIP